MLTAMQQPVTQDVEEVIVDVCEETDYLQPDMNLRDLLIQEKTVTNAHQPQTVDFLNSIFHQNSDTAAMLLVKLRATQQHAHTQTEINEHKHAQSAQPRTQKKTHRKKYSAQYKPTRHRSRKTKVA